MKMTVYQSIIKASIILTVGSSISACTFIFGDDSTFRDRSNDYRTAKEESVLIIPEGISTETIYDSYAIPLINDNTSLTSEFEVPKPEPLSEDLGREIVRINKLADDRWILVNGAPGEVWPRLRGFLSLNELSVQRVDTVGGVLETQWLTPSTEGSLRERYQLRIEQGVQRKTSEVHILHADIRAGEEDWPTQSSNDERENLMVKELAQYLANSAQAASVSMLAQQALDSSGKISIEEYANKRPYIKLQLPFSRAWASLRQALGKAGYTIDDLDRSKRLFYVAYSKRRAEQGEDEERGFFASLFFGEEEDDSINYVVKVKDLEAGTVEVVIERQDESAIEKADAEYLLKLIKRHIS